MSQPTRPTTTKSPPAGQDENRVWTIGQVLRWTQGRFAGAGLASPRLDAELLLCHALTKQRVALYTGLDQPLGPDELTRYRELIRRRLGGEPVAYLIGQKEFWSLPLQVSDAVLVPRPETEVLVEVALDLIRRDRQAPEGGDGQEGQHDPSRQVQALPGEELVVHYDEPAEQEWPEQAPAEGEEGGTGLAGSEGRAEANPPGASAGEVARGGPEPTETAREAAGAGPAAGQGSAGSGDKAVGPLIADIGTGSGAIALALKKEVPDAHVVAVDRSEAALAVATENATRLGLSVEFLHGDLLSPLHGHGRGRFDLIVSNPPYILTSDLPGLPPEVQAEPRQALDGGADGLAVIRRLIADARACLCPGGALAMEVGAGQADAVAALLRQAGYQDVAITPDLARIPRVVAARWRG